MTEITTVNSSYMSSVTTKSEKSIYAGNDSQSTELNTISYDKDTHVSIKAMQSRLDIKYPSQSHEDKWGYGLMMESYHGITKNSGGISSIIPNDPSAFYGKGKLNYHINRLSYNLDNYDRKCFMVFYAQNKIFNQEGEGSKYSAMLNDVGFRFKTATKNYNEDWNITPYFSLDYSRNNTDTEIPDLGKYLSNTFSYSFGIESITLPYFSDNIWYRDVFDKTEIGLSSLVSYEKGTPDFSLYTFGASFSLRQRLLSKLYPVSVGLTCNISKSHSESELFGASDYNYRGYDLDVGIKPFYFLPESLIVLKNIKLDYKKSLNSAALGSNDFEQESSGSKDQMTIQIPVFNKFSKGKSYLLNIGGRYAFANNEAGLSRSENDTFAYGINFAMNW